VEAQWLPVSWRIVIHSMTTSLIIIVLHALVWQCEHACNRKARARARAPAGRRGGVEEGEEAEARVHAPPLLRHERAQQHAQLARVREAREERRRRTQLLLEARKCREHLCGVCVGDDLTMQMQRALAWLALSTAD
jgi:hypothetical protein